MLKEILENERNRTLDNIDKIFLYKDGNGPWYKAYEWSAYLLEYYPGGPEDKLKPTRKPYNGDISSFVSVSFQLSSFDKFVPGKIIVSQDDKKIVLSCDIRKYEEPISLEAKDNILDNWKKTIDLKDKKEKVVREQKNVFGNHTSFTSILKSIITYDTYGKNGDELRTFINELKEECANLIF